MPADGAVRLSIICTALARVVTSAAECSICAAPAVHGVGPDTTMAPISH